MQVKSSHEALLLKIPQEDMSLSITRDQPLSVSGHDEMDDLIFMPFELDVDRTCREIPASDDLVFPS